MRTKLIKCPQALECSLKETSELLSLCVEPGTTCLSLFRIHGPSVANLTEYSGIFFVPGVVYFAFDMD